MNWTPERQKEAERESYLNHREERIDAAKKWRENNLERDREIKRNAQRRNGERYRLEQKMKVISHYSNGTMKCVNPFNIDHSGFELLEDYIKTLQIDHIDGNGRKHRKSIGIKNGGITFYNWLIKNGFPEGFQVLCANCNWIKRHRNKEIYFKEK
jgi:hypothetical protein